MNKRRIRSSWCPQKEHQWKHYRNFPVFLSLYLTTYRSQYLIYSFFVLKMNIYPTYMIAHAIDKRIIEIMRRAKTISVSCISGKVMDKCSWQNDSTYFFLKVKFFFTFFWENQSENYLVHSSRERIFQLKVISFSPWIAKDEYVKFQWVLKLLW